MDWAENTISNTTSIVAWISLATGTCLPSRCLKMALVYLLILQLLHSNWLYILQHWSGDHFRNWLLKPAHPTFLTTFARASRLWHHLCAAIKTWRSTRYQCSMHVFIFTTQKRTSKSEVHPNYGRKTLPEMWRIFRFIHEIFCSSSGTDNTTGNRTVLLNSAIYFLSNSSY